MKQLAMVIAGLLVFGTSAFAQHIGPATPHPEYLKTNIGVGYVYHQAEWDGADIEQNRLIAHIGVGLGDFGRPKTEVYLRLGLNDLEIDDAMADGSSFDDSSQFSVGGGVKWEFLQGNIFGWGGVLQGMYFGNWSDEDSLGISYDVEDAYELEVAFPIQVKAGPALIYAGPLFYVAEADIEVEVMGLSGSGDVEEDNNVGAFGGVAFRINNFSIEAEAQYKSDLSASVFASFAF